MVKWHVNGITQFCKILIEKVAFFILKKVNQGENGKTHKTDLSVAAWMIQKKVLKISTHVSLL